MSFARAFTSPACPPTCAARVRGGRAVPYQPIMGWLFLACAMAIPASAQRAVPSSSVADDTVVLTLANVQRLSLARNPASLAEREDIAIANAGLRRARTMPFNPDVSMQSTGRGGTTEAVATQEVEVLGQRGLRVNVAHIGVGRATALVSNAGRLVVSEASLVFARAVAAERRVVVTREGLGLVDGSRLTPATSGGRGRRPRTSERDLIQTGGARPPQRTPPESLRHRGHRRPARYPCHRPRYR